MASGGSSQPTNQPWSGQKQPLLNLYDAASNQVLRKATPLQYGEVSKGRRLDELQDTTGIDARNAGQLSNLGLDAGATQTAIESGGFIPFTGVEQEAQAGALDLARAGVNPYLTGAQESLASNQGLNYLDQSASGQYLSHETNPYLADAVGAAQDRLIDRFQGDILPSVTGQFGAAGRFGSGAHQYAVQRATDDFTRNLADSATNAYLANYSQERGNQLAAQQGLTEGIQRNAALAPTLSGAVRQEQLGNLGLLEGVGSAQAGKIGELSAQQQGLFDFRQNDARNRLQEYAQLIQGTPIITGQQGGGGTNRAAGALGGAATGAALGSTVGPWGTAAGAAIGGLGGLFL